MNEITQEEIDAEVQKISKDPQSAAKELIRLRETVEIQQYTQYAMDLIQERKHMHATFSGCSIQANLKG